MNGPLLIADAPALLYRAFFALPDSITDGDGHPVNALLGSVNQVLWCIERYAPRAVVLCFGAEAGAYRVEAFPAYHADRPPMPDPLAHQWARAPELYEALGWYVHGHDELEADDLLHSLAEVETAAGGSTLILTGDRDLFQCVERRRDRAAAAHGRQRAGGGHAPTWCTRSTASTPSRCRTSSRCAATRPTACRARRASGPRRPPTCCGARATSST